METMSEGMLSHWKLMALKRPVFTWDKIDAVVRTWF
jgi:hypothetical protein